MQRNKLSSLIFISQFHEEQSYDYTSPSSHATISRMLLRVGYNEYVIIAEDDRDDHDVDDW